MFRESQDNGTELLITAKPLTREKLILVKFLVFGTYVLIFTIATLILVLFIFVVPNVNYHTVASIMFSVAATSLIQMLFFWFNCNLVLIKIK